MLAGDASGNKKYAYSEIMAKIQTDPQELASGIEMQQSMFPNMIKVISSEITDNKAVLTMKGERGGQIADGVVTMLREDGKWKVNKQSWKSSSVTK